MADLPTPRSYQQILGELIDSYTADVGVRRLKVGNPILSLLEAAARSDFRGSLDSLRLLQAVDLDHADGLALSLAGAQEGLAQRNPLRATATLTFSDASFQKVSTDVFRGSGAPIVGTVALRVEEAGDFPATGDVYVGRGTPNAEGPLHYASKADAGPYWVLNLSTPTTRFHNVGEAVTLAQGGNRSVPAGTVAATQDGSLTASVRFSTVAAAVIPDGEVEVAGVRASCAEVGEAGNVPAESVQVLPSPPFTGARVTNPEPVTTGRDVESNDAFRSRIRAARASRVRGTDLALKQAAVGVTSPDEDRTVVSAALVRRANRPSTLFVDDGSGYEEGSAGVGLESVVDGAAGGEVDRQTLNRPVTKAALRAREQAPYALVDSSQLSLRVGGVVTTHAFDASEFGSIGSASAYEVVAAVNRDPALLWAARTTGGGRYVEFFARSEENDDVQVVDPVGALQDAARVLDVPTSPAYTAALYKNDRLLTKDGLLAVFRSAPAALWGTLAGAQTLTLAVDETPEATYEFTDQSFVDAGTPYDSVGHNDLEAWAAVVNRTVPGVTASVEADRLALTSNRGRSDAARVAVSGGTLVTNLVFAPGEVAGASHDYDLDRGTGQIHLEQALAPGDRLTLGSAWTRGFLETPSIPPTDLPAGARLWFAVDGGAEVVVGGAGPTVDYSIEVVGVTDWGVRLGFTATFADPAENPWADVQPGDWLVVSDPDPAVPAAWRRAWRVVEVVSPDDTTFTMVVEQATMRAPRFGHASAPIPPHPTLHRVLVTGGWAVDRAVFHGGTRLGDAAMNQCEVYDPADGSWVVAASMSVARAKHTATPLPDGRVLVAGGYDQAGNPLATTEVYDPVADAWSAGPTMGTARAEHTATLLGSGLVLIAGGRDTPTTETATACTYDFTSNTLTNVASMGTARYAHAALLLPAGSAEAGNVLVVGGRTFAAAAAIPAERYNTAAPGWANKATPPSARWDLGLSYWNPTTVVATGSGEGGASKATFNTYNVGSNTWSADTAIDTPAVTSTANPQGLVRTAAGAVHLLYATENLGTSSSPPFTEDGRRLVHRTFNGTTWDDLAGPAWPAAGAERCGATVTACGTGADEVLVAIGGVNARNQGAGVDAGVPVASTEQIDADDEWSAPAPQLAADVHLPNRGLAVVRSSGDLALVEVPAGSDYTAASLQPELAFEGGRASVYRTSRLRAYTLTNAPGGSILLAASTAPDLLPLPVGREESSGQAHSAVLVSASDLSTPEALQVRHVVGAGAAQDPGDEALVVLDPPQVPAVGALPLGSGHVATVHEVGDGRNPASWHVGWTAGNDPGFRRVGDYGQALSLGQVTADRRATTADGAPDSDLARVRAGLRVKPRSPLTAGQSAFVTGGYAVGPGDGLTLQAGPDRFNLSLARRMSTLGSYSSQVTLRDEDGGDVALQDTFGPGFRFEDHAVYMRARGKTHSGDASRRILWRWWRHGPDGERVAVRYAYQAEPGAQVRVTVSLDQSLEENKSDETLAFVDVYLPTGTARANPRLTTASRVGVADNNPNPGNVRDVYVMTGFSVVSATRAASGDPTRLRLQVPNDGTVAHGPQSTGLQIGDVLWLEVAVPGADLYSGPFTVSQVDAFNAGTGQQDVYVPAGFLHAGTAPGTIANPGTVSFDPAGEATFDPATAVGDLVSLSGDFPAQYVDAGAMSVAATGRQYVRARATGLGTPSTGTVWTTLADLDWLQVYSGSTTTATALAAAVNALAADPESGCPVTATVVGTGSGVMSTSSADEGASATAVGCRLRDGVNWVQRTVPPPGPSDETSVVLKRAPDSSLLANADWENEDVRVCPVLAADVATWLNTPAVTGLWTVADVDAAGAGHRVQVSTKALGSDASVEVQDGTGNLATAAVVGGGRYKASDVLWARGDAVVVAVARDAAAGFVGDRWVDVDNASVAAKPTPWLAGGEVSEFTSSGLVRFGGPDPAYDLVGTFDGARLRVEPWGDLVAVRWSKLGNFEFPTTEDAAPGGYLYLCTPTDNHSDYPVLGAENLGVFRILYASEDSREVVVWVRNAHATAATGVAKAKLLGAGSPVPGDTLSVGTDALGSGNRGSWRVAEVGAATPGGEQFVDQTLRLDVSAQTPQTLTSPVVLTADQAAAVQFLEGEPMRQVKQLLTVTPNQDDPAYVDLQLYPGAGWGSCNETLGTVVRARDKLGFPVGAAVGVDGYRHATGLVQEVNRVVYGDPADEVTYPGYAAAGARILVSGPVVRRVQLAVQARVRSGAASEDLADRIRSAAAAAVNRVGVDQGGIAVSDVISECAKVPGVVALSIVSPAYDPVRDRIELGPGEKPLVLNLRNDVRVSFVET